MQLTARETNVPEGGTITLAFSGAGQMEIHPPSAAAFLLPLGRARLVALQPANNISFIDLPAGKHYFQVRAMDRNGNIDPNPARLEFAVILPWYKESRLVLIMLAGLAAGALLRRAGVQPPPAIAPQLRRGGKEGRRAHARAGNRQPRVAAQPEDERPGHARRRHRP